MKAAIYARVSTLDQNTENQLQELRQYCAARQWTVVEFVDRGVSGSKESRPALDELTQAVRRKGVDIVAVFALDRLGRSLSHLIRLVEDWQHLGVGLVSLREGLDLTTASGRLQLHLLAALAQFEKERIRERVMAGLQRARAQGKALGRPKADIHLERLATVQSLSLTDAAAALGVSRSTLKRWRRGQKSLSSAA
jgi:putative DNA-invertase from lambdoid prophage Rac